MDKSNKKFALLIASEIPRKINIYGDLGDLFYDFLYDENEIWDKYKCYEDEFPEDLLEYDGFIITGSEFYASDNKPWIERLKHLIRELHKLKKNLLGECFGHHIIAVALGGKVGKKNADYVPGMFTLNITKDGYERFPQLEGYSELVYSKCHTEIVTELPPEAKLIATGSDTLVEIFSIGDHILGLQGHPE